MCLPADTMSLPEFDAAVSRLTAEKALQENAAEMLKHLKEILGWATEGNGEVHFEQSDAKYLRRMIAKAEGRA